MQTSILNTVKPYCGITPEQTNFDVIIIPNINTVLADLYQLGVGPKTGFAVLDEHTTWEEFIGVNDPRFSNLITYVGLRVRMLFDPPTNSTVSASIEREIAKLEWRLNIAGETYEPPEEE